LEQQGRCHLSHNLLCDFLVVLNNPVIRNSKYSSNDISWSALFKIEATHGGSSENAESLLQSSG
jgi:hypothetical protein